MKQPQAREGIIRPGVPGRSGVPVSQSLVWIAALVAVLTVWGIATWPAAAHEDAGEPVVQDRHGMRLDAMWERGHIVANLETGLSIVPNGTLSLSVGIDGVLGGKASFATLVRRVSWQHAIPLGTGERRQGDPGEADLDGSGQSAGRRHMLGFELGKSTRRLGRGRIDSLLLAGRLPGFPLIGMSLEGPRYRFDKIAGDLATAAQPYKRLALYRIAYDVTPSLSVGFGEASVRSEAFPGDLFYDLVPGLPLYLAKFLPGGPLKDNNLVYLDAEIRAGETIGYGEVLINEFPAALWLSKNPPLFGVLVGVERGPWLVEYSLLTNYAYSNGDKGSVYSHDGRSLGHWMGGDGDSLEVRWNHEVVPGWRITLGGFQWRKGEGKVDSWFATLQEREENAFLSGVVETTRGFYGAAAAHLGDWGSLGGLTLNGDIRVGVVTNENHTMGVTGWIVTASVGASFEF